MRKITLFFLITLSFSLSANEFYYAHDKKIEVKELQEKYNALDTIQYYQTTDGRVLGVNNEIIVQCKEAVTCPKTLNNMGFNKVSKLSKILYLIQINDEDNVFELSVKLYEDPAIILAHPNFIKERTRR